MEKYESTVKQVASPIDRVYAKLSDLTSLQALKDRVDDPMFEQMLNSQLPQDKRPTPEQLAKLRANRHKMELTADTMSGHIGPLGDITVRIVERNEPKLVKMDMQGAPVPVTLWIQLLPSNESTCRMKVTLGAELNFFIRKMIQSKLEKGVEGIAQFLAALPY